MRSAFDPPGAVRHHVAAQAGLAQLGSVRGYSSAPYGLLAIVVGTFAAIRVAATAAAPWRHVGVAVRIDGPVDGDRR